MTHDGSRNVSGSSCNPYRRKGVQGPIISGFEAMSHVRHKPSSFEEYWLASKAWERKGLPLGTARALENAGFLTIDDLESAPLWELAAVPRVGKKSFTILLDLRRRLPEASMSRGAHN
ncbi:hypothetical protein RSO01_85210 [Reyranella soli]|uniref:RNA polymerase alpha subunit C-terminal domain-containing protein n=1 Tax=Reyranella soli TaxID=1230389 RepID=A0A512NQX9_9HYPH|nr:hypothetical protein RSO01_85210 [Reyranella soli]